MSGEKLDLSGQGAVYIRVSTDEQDTERQFKTIGRFLKKHEVQVSDEFWYEDHGYARDETDRPDFQRLLKDIENRRVKWVLIDQQSRFGTKTKKQFFHFLYVMELAQCRLIAAEHEKDLTEDDLATLITTLCEAERSVKEPRDTSWRVMNKLVLMAKKGIHLGGLPPFGCDVAIYPNETSKEELWRVVYQPELGKHKRIKVFPDGRIERCDGKRKFPYVEEEHVRRLAPSLDQRKLIACQEIFSKFRAEAVSYNKLAGILNAYGFRAGGGGLFNATHIADMLTQPAYIGRPAWNRRHAGKFHAWRNGEMQKTSDDGKHCTPNAREDWIIADRQIFDPIVEAEVWDAVQSKKQGRQPKDRLPRSDALLFSGLVVCAHCGQKMAGSKRRMRNGEFQHEYFCSTYHKHVSGGMKEHCPCGRNTVIQDFLVERVRESLHDVAQQLDAIQQAIRTGSIAMLEPFRSKQLECGSRIIELTIEMQKYVFARKGEIVIRSGEGLMASVQRAYGALFANDTSLTRLSVEKMKKEHDDLTQKLWQLEDRPGLKRVQEKTVARLRELEAQMDLEEAMLTNLSNEMSVQQSIFKETAERNEAAIKALDDESRFSAMRERNQAVRSAIRVIEVWFAPVTDSDSRKTGQIRKNTTKVVQVQIETVVGEPRIWKRGDHDNTDSHADSPDRG